MAEQRPQKDWFKAWSIAYRLTSHSKQEPPFWAALSQIL